MSTAEQRASILAAGILANTTTEDDWLAVSALADQLQRQAWNHQVRHMLKPRDAKQRLADAVYRGLKVVK